MKYFKSHLVGFINSCQIFFEKVKIKNAIKKKKIFVLILDLNVSAIRIGTWIVYMYLARFFHKKKIQIKLFIIEADQKNYFKFNVTKKDYEYYCSSLVKIFLVFAESCKVEFIKSNQLKKKISDKDVHIVFKKKVLQRIPIYNRFFFLLSLLLQSEKNNFLNKYLIKANELNNFVGKNYIKSIKKIKKYITLQIRKDKFHQIKKNIPENYFLQLCYFFKKNHPNFKLIIISDDHGSSFARKLIKKNLLLDKNVIIAKDLQKFCTSLDQKLLCDMYLLFKAKQNISTKYSGGINPVYLISKTPFFHYGPVSKRLMRMHRERYTFKKIFYFHDNNNQLHFNEYSTNNDQLIFDLMKKNINIK